MKKHQIKWIEAGSIAEEMELEPGDCVISINGNPLEDVFDYRFYIQEEELVMLIEKADGEEWELEIEKDLEEDLGIIFENNLMDDYRSCNNKCMFCFIDQMPPGMRDTLYFKDDDTRLSFLQGNYITLTNLKEKDVQRIIDYRMEPINISVHTTEEELRCKMLQNRFAGKSLAIMKQLAEAHIIMNGQVVLCKDVNDGIHLEKTIRDLMNYIPYMESLSIVPIGMTKYRQNLVQVEPFTKEDAKEVLTLIHHLQDECFEKYGKYFVQAGDEWYLLAEEELPGEERYEGYLQLDNGVGMLRTLIEEFHKALEESKPDTKQRTLSIGTGKAAYKTLKLLLDSMKEKFPNTNVELIQIENRFFGEQITVTGLITGIDLKEQLSNRKLGTKLLLSQYMFRNQEEVFLDDITKAELESALQVSIDIVKSSGYELLQSILKQEGEKNE